MTMLTASFDRAEEGAYDRMTQAWQWLCEQRTLAPDHADVWDIRWQNLNTSEHWLTDLTDRVLRGEYRLTPLQLQGIDEQRQAVWGAQDALVLKWVALSLQHLLPLHESCEHVKGHGGGKQSIEKLHSLLTAQSVDSEKKTAAGTTPDAADIRHYKWVCRTDIRGYYRNINKQTLMQQVRQHVSAPVLRDLVQQYIHYTVEDDGTFHTPEKGISRGCPLSPLMGALHLFDMDEHFSNQPNIHYARYMDDVIILAKSRWSLRKHTKRLMQWFGEYGFEAHPDKTQIGRTEKGFDWMGAWLTHEGVTDVAPRAKANHREKVRRLYEQLARLPKWMRKSAAPKVHARVSAYRKRWNIWAEQINTAVPRGERPADHVPAMGHCQSGARSCTQIADDYDLCGVTLPPAPAATVPALRLLSLLVASACIAILAQHKCIAGTVQGATLNPNNIPVGTPPGYRWTSSYVADGGGMDISETNGWGAGAAVQLTSSGGASIVPGVPNIGSNNGDVVIATPAAKACGLGVAIGEVKAYEAFGQTNNDIRILPATGDMTNASAQLVNCSMKGPSSRGCSITAVAGIDGVYLGVPAGNAAGTCPANTTIANVCAQRIDFGKKSTFTTSGIWAATTTLPSSCPSGSTMVRIATAGAYTPPESPTCTIILTPTNGTPNIPDILPAQISGSIKGSVLSVGDDPVTTTATCTTSKGNVNVQTTGVYTTSGADFPSVAGFDAGTNTYVGLLTAGSPKATLGTVVTTADLWTKTASGPSPQITSLVPIVIRGGGAPTVGSGNVVMTVSAVAP
ncbi:hypothetical protein FCM30_06860 [Lelliottia aquatilis]|uniref:reverse transcriptase domain-containing protein n=1 Tax=Lelliottia aquatilis TaxID=2080838 RepID=UPI001576C2B5|nr:reverse transcriptase domain-containing protein [Lelliottia aquatilis]NTZ45482.1 hypothetical protein [Lelliottia aquatilis]